MLQVPITMSTSSCRPKCSVVPLPPLPKTPIEWASSTIILAPYFLPNFTISGNSAMSPSVLNTPSTTINLPREGLIDSRVLSKSSILLCLNLFISPKESRQPSMILAWSSLSVITTSSFPTKPAIVPKLVRNPVVKKRAASFPTNSASFDSSSS